MSCATQGRPSPSLGIGPLLRDELTVPGKQRIWCHKRLGFIKQPATKDPGFPGQSYPLFVGEPKPPSFELILENTVLFDEIVDDRLLVVVKPADQGNNEEVEGNSPRTPNREN